MAINIRKVVSTDFSVYREITPISSYGNTVVINVSTKNEDEISGTSVPMPETYTYTSYDEYTQPTFVVDSWFNTYDAYMYFTLGGKKLTILNVYEENFESDNTADIIYKQLIKHKKSVSNTENDFICVCIPNKVSDKTFKGLINKVEQEKAPYKMLLLRSVTDDTTSTSIETETKNSDNDLQVVANQDTTVLQTEEEFPNNLPKSHSVIYKYYKCAKDSKCNATLTIAAYLSKINLTNNSNLRDYCYTDESSVVNVGTKQFKDNTLIETGVSDTDFDVYRDKVNFIDKIGNRIVNFGGNTAAGTSIIAEFGAICVENAIIQAVLETMLQKQYLTNAGLNNVVSKIHSVMEDYITNGFLQPNSTYTGSTRYYNYGDSSYKVIDTGDELVDGYVVVTIPMSKLTASDTQARKFTPIYIYMQTLGGARTVEITGDILD